MKRFSTSLLGLALVLISCGQAQEPKLVAKIKQFDAAWNAHNFDAIMPFFADGATVKLMPPPPDGGVYTGKQQIEDWVKSLLPGFRVESIHFRQEGNTVKWLFTVHSDFFGQMGVNPVKGEATAVFEKDKIKSFTPMFNQETVGKMLAVQFLQMFDAGTDLNVMAEQLLTPDFVAHYLGQPVMDREAYKQLGAMFRTGFSGMKHTIEDLIAKGDRVVTRGKVTSTHTGEFQGVPASGKPVTVTFIVVDRIANGKIAERWVDFDALGLMTQIGAIPAPAQRAN